MEMNWENKTEVKKGNFAEKIIHKYLEDKGYSIYKPTTPGPHCFDRLAIKDKKYIIIAEIKAKAKLNNYDETGIELRHYNDYKYISDLHKIPIFIFFVDEMLKEIYGNYLSILEVNSRKAPWGDQILFKMNNMKRNIYNLSENETHILKELSTRNYNYKQQ